MEKKYDRLPLFFTGVVVKYSSNHRGVDFGYNNSYGGPNAPIYASTDGIVTMATSWGTAGNTIRLRYDSPNKDYSIFTQYKHLSRIDVGVGQTISRGQAIGLMGDSGAPGQYHLHFDYVKTPYQYDYQQSANDRARYSLDPLEYCYLFDNQIVGDSASLVTKVVGTSKQVARDTNKAQIEVKGMFLRARTGAGTNASVLGYIDFGLYNILEEKESNGYTWAKVSDGIWIAETKEDTIVYKGEDEKVIEELKKEIEVLKLRIAELEKDIIEKDKVILKQNIVINDLLKKIEELESRTWLSMFIEWLKKIFKK